MANVIVDENSLAGIAEAIRDKLNVETLYKPGEMAAAIESISGGGGGSTLIEKSISANGTYNASDDSADGYSKVAVNVPASAVDTGTKNINSNGTHDVTGYASASVNVPNSYAAGDEGKVVQNGALVSQTSQSITENGTYDTTLKNSVTVNVQGGGGESYDGIEIKTDANGKITEYAFHMDVVPDLVLNYLGYNRNPSNDGVPSLTFAKSPTHIGKYAFFSAKVAFDWSGLTELQTVGNDYALVVGYASGAQDGSSSVVNLPKFVGYYDNTKSGLDVFRTNSTYAPKQFILPLCTVLPQYGWYTYSVTGLDVTVGSIGHPVTDAKSKPFGGTSATGTVTVYTTGALLDSLKTKVQDGAGANISFVYKASEATTYGGVSYAAGDTMLTV